MKRFLRVNILVLSCLLVFGCGHKQKQTAPSGEFVEDAIQSNMYGDAGRHQQRYRELLPTPMERKSNAHLMRTAHSALGTPYVRGGVDPSGFDCSGFVQWTYKSVGVKLPRTAREQSVIGKRINNIEDMVAGDIVTFRHPKRGYHTGIYVGDGKFIHSPRKRTRVRINNLNDAYFSSTFTGARRVALSGNENLVAQAESRLAAEPAMRGDNRKSRSAKQAKGQKKSRLIASSEKKMPQRKATTVSKAARDGKVARKVQEGKSKKLSRGSVQANRSGNGKHRAERTKRGKAKTSASNESRKSSKTTASRG